MLPVSISRLFFGGGRGLNPEPCIYYVLFLPTELSSQGFYLYTLSGCQTFLFVHKTFQLLCIVVFLYATWIVIEYSVV